MDVNEIQNDKIQEIKGRTLATEKSDDPTESDSQSKSDITTSSEISDLDIENDLD